MKARLLTAACLWAVIGPVNAAIAADPVYPGGTTVEYKDPSGWTFSVTGYAWLAGLEGDVGVNGNVAHVDASIGDVLSNFDIGYMSVAEARYERFGVFTDVVYGKLSASQDTPLGILANNVDLSSQSLMWTVAGEYRLVDTPEASLDAFAGFRLYWLKNELEFNPPGLLGGTTASQTETWADPIVGLKGRYSFSPQFYLTAWGLVGGGASSEVLWDIMGGVGYDFSDSWSAVVGYRAAGVDYENDGFVYDTVQQGPILGVTYRF